MALTDNGATLLNDLIDKLFQGASSSTDRASQCKNRIIECFTVLVVFVESTHQVLTRALLLPILILNHQLTLVVFFHIMVMSEASQLASQARPHHCCSWSAAMVLELHLTRCYQPDNLYNSKLFTLRYLLLFCALLYCCMSLFVF